jgi:hypothetical protein
MNALDRIFMNVVKSSAAARLLGAVAAASCVGACAGPIASVKVDPSSPIAPEVAKLATQDKDFPSFNEIPAAPTDVRPPQIYGQRAQALETARAELDRATAPNTWTLGETTSFAARARSDAGPDLAAPNAADTEAFVNSVRKRATPPPPAAH